METYQGMYKRHSQEFERLPIFFAFTKEDFEQELQKRGATKKDIYSTGAGGFFLKSDADLIRKTTERLTAELEEAMKDDDFLYSAFYYELGNHEYAVTFDPTDTLDALNLTIEDVENNERMLKIFNLAKKNYLKKIFV